MAHQQPLFPQQVINQHGGTIQINNIAPHQESNESLGPNTSMRFLPSEKDDYQQGMKRDSFQSLNPYVRDVMKIGNYFNKAERDDLIANRAFYRFLMQHKRVLADMINAMRQ